MIWWVFGLFLLLWTIGSVWYFLSLMGYKFRKDKWYDYPILLPAVVIISLYVIARFRFDR